MATKGETPGIFAKSAPLWFLTTTNNLRSVAIPEDDPEFHCLVPLAAQECQSVLLEARASTTRKILMHCIHLGTGIFRYVRL
jgi:hypothetical protein